LRKYIEFAPTGHWQIHRAYMQLILSNADNNASRDSDDAAGIERRRPGFCAEAYETFKKGVAALKLYENCYCTVRSRATFTVCTENRRNFLRTCTKRACWVRVRRSLPVITSAPFLHAQKVRGVRGEEAQQSSARAASRYRTVHVNARPSIGRSTRKSARNLPRDGRNAKRPFLLLIIETSKCENIKNWRSIQETRKKLRRHCVQIQIVRHVNVWEHPIR